MLRAVATAAAAAAARRRAGLGRARGAGGRAAAPHDVLGVGRGASADECKAAFRRLALALHPDVNRGDADAPAKFAEVVAAYEAIERGDEDAPQRRGLRGLRAVGDVVIGSIESLRREPALRVFAVRLLLDREEDGGGGKSGSGSDDSAAEGALSSEIVREVVASRWDSVEDAKRLAHAAYGLDPPQERRAGRGQASSELVSRGRLCGGHLFLDDYGVNDGDLVHLVVGADDVG
jgi:curved DNA-binding protein CbpA